MLMIHLTLAADPPAPMPTPTPPAKRLKRKGGGTYLAFEPPGISQSEIVYSTQVDLDGAGVLDDFKIVHVSGRHYVDDVLWCGGRGADKREGEFDVCISLQGRPAACTRLNSLLCANSESSREAAGSLWFYVGDPDAWDLKFVDFNGDGRADFVLGQYCGCSNWCQYVLTTEPSGHVVLLIPDPVVGNFGNTDEFTIIPGGFCHCVFQPGGARCTVYEVSGPDLVLSRRTREPDECP
jgi:hypothetical protein